MSSAILYLAIVAIWAVVLVPRWLRNDADQERSSAPARPGEVARDSAATEGRADVDDPPDDPPDGWLTEDERRGRVLSARRKLLCMLLVLAAGAALIAVARLAAWWVVVPPAMMLAGYLVLLREAAKADAERRMAEHRAEARARSAGMDTGMAAYERAAARRPEARGQPAVPSWPAAAAPGTAVPADPAATAETEPLAEEAEPTAEVLDISARVAEEPYDQYADTGLRAVGD